MCEALPLFAFTGQGNVLPGSEFNFLTDPEAALVVIQRATCPVIIIPWDTVLLTTVSWVRKILYLPLI